MNPKKTTVNSKPEHVVRRGEVMAAVFVRQSNAGYAYFDFSLKRAWVSRTTGKESHGTSFFDHHEDQLVEVVKEASAWIRERVRSTSAANDAGSDGESS
jgi:hypothetical protein